MGRLTATVVAFMVLLSGLSVTWSAWTATTSSEGSAFESAETFEPEGLTAPQITGTVADDETLTSSEGTWSGPNLSFSYSWDGCSSTFEVMLEQECFAVGSGSSLLLDIDDPDATTLAHGTRYRVTVTASNSSGTASQQSAFTSYFRLPGWAFLAGAKPSITGTLTVGQTITLNAGEWEDTSQYRYTLLWCSDPTCSLYSADGSAPDVIDTATSHQMTVEAPWSGMYLRVVVAAQSDTPDSDTQYAISAPVGPVS